METEKDEEKREEKPNKLTMPARIRKRLGLGHERQVEIGQDQLVVGVRPSVVRAAAEDAAVGRDDGGAAEARVAHDRRAGGLHLRDPGLAQHRGAVQDEGLGLDGVGLRLRQAACGSARAWSVSPGNESTQSVVRWWLRKGEGSERGKDKKREEVKGKGNGRRKERNRTDLPSTSSRIPASPAQTDPAVATQRRGSAPLGQTCST